MPSMPLNIEIKARCNNPEFVLQRLKELLRHIFYIENVKFHVDEVMSLGSFVEIEAGDLSAISPRTNSRPGAIIT